MHAQVKHSTALKIGPLTSAVPNREYPFEIPQEKFIRKQLPGNCLSSHGTNVYSNVILEAEHIRYVIYVDIILYNIEGTVLL